MFRLAQRNGCPHFLHRIAPLLLFALLPAGPHVLATPRFRSDAVIGREVQCSDQEKFCFRFNRVLSSADGKCLPLTADCDVGTHKHLEGEVKLFINRTESNVYGRFAATCRKTYCEDANDPNKLCPVPYVPYNEAKQLCGELPVRSNMYGDLECECAECEAPDGVAQPEESGKCRVPDLWKSYRGEASVGGDVLRSPCSDEELRCFREGKVLYEGACRHLLQRGGDGACADGEWLVLYEVHHVVKRQLRARCAPPRCPAPGDVWMAVTRRCHPRVDVERRVCVGATAVLAEDAFGRAGCVTEAPEHFGLPQRRQGAACVADEREATDALFRAATECELTVDGACRD